MSAVVAASLPTLCAVCRGLRMVQLVELVGFFGGGLMACPHCTAGLHPIPITVFPDRDDQPRGDVA